MPCEKRGYIRLLEHSHLHCYVCQEQRDLVAAGDCMLEELNREVCQILPRLMEHLTHRRSRFELSHILMTPPEACHHGCYPTQCTHSARSCILKWKTFHQQKNLFDVTKQLSLIRFVSFSSCYTKVLRTRSCQLVCELLEFINKSNQCSLSSGSSFLSVQIISI